MQVRLTPHPTSPRSPVDTITVVLARDGGGLWVHYAAEGNLRDVRWPAPALGRADELWRHTCFEAFVEAQDGYVEFNLSPSGQWASYRFDAPRLGMRVADEAPNMPMLQDHAETEFSLETRLWLPNGARRLGLSAVIEATDGTISYWALAHPSDKPDFHHPDSFVLELP